MNLANAIDFAQASGVPEADVDAFLLVAGVVAASPALASLGTAVFDEVVDPLGYSTSPLRLWSDPRVADLDVTGLRTAVQGSMLSLRSIRLAFGGEVDDDLVERLRASGRHPWQRSLSMARSDASLTRPLDWPIRLAVPDDVWDSLTAHEWAPALITLVDPTRPGARPHLVVASADRLRQWSAVMPERASLVVAVGPDPLPDELFGLLATAAGAWAYLPGATPAAVASVASGLVVELSHNHAVDEALALFTSYLGLGAPLLVAPVAWLATSRLSGAIARTGNRQDRVVAIDRSRPTRSRRRGDPPKPATGGAGTAAEFDVRYRNRAFLSEVTDATEVAPDLYDARRRLADREDRYLTADVEPASGGENSSAGGLSVWIAPLEMAGQAVAPDRFVDESLPWDGVAIPLDLVLFELRDGGLTARRRIELPPRGASSRAEFHLEWKGGPFDARVVVLYEHRFVQSMLLTVDTTGRRVSMDRECLIRPADADLLDATPSQARRSCSTTTMARSSRWPPLRARRSGRPRGSTSCAAR